jgi:hypothetical protein
LLVGDEDVEDEAGEKVFEKALVLSIGFSSMSKDGECAQPLPVKMQTEQKGDFQR